MRSLKNKKGFTLIELMVVIVILGILAILAIPKFTAVTAKAKMSEVPGILSSYEHAQMAYIAETGTYGDVNSLTFESPSSKWFTYEEKTPADNNDFQAEAKNDVGDFSNGSAVWTEYSGGNFTHDATAADKPAAQKYIPNFF